MPDPGFLAFAVSAGAAATLNPCGFAMLPAYVAYFLGREEDAASPFRGLIGGLQGGIAMTLGVLGVFGTIGAVLSLASRGILRYFPWANIAIGVAIVVLGLVMLLRRSAQVGLALSNPFSYRPEVVTDRRVSGLLLFGAGYGIASLGCTLPIFLVVVTQALAAGGLLGGVMVFIAYGLGMGSMLLALSLAVATGKGVIVRGLRSLVPHVRTLGAVGLILSGSYLIYYQVTVGRSLLFLR
ncbi:MAG: cytochrome c biogenesis CcdA family protein [Armatimonadota bacterium]